MPGKGPHRMSGCSPLRTGEHLVTCTTDAQTAIQNNLLHPAVKILHNVGQQTGVLQSSPMTGAVANDLTAAEDVTVPTGHLATDGLRVDSYRPTLISNLPSIEAHNNPKLNLKTCTTPHAATNSWHPQLRSPEILRLYPRTG